MIDKTDKPGRFSNERIWFISFFFETCRLRHLFIIAILLVFSENSRSQCPSSDFFRDKISVVFNSANEKNEDQLKELLQVQKQMEECHFGKDSSFMFLTQKIAVLFFRKLNYSAAIDFANQSIRIAKECIIMHTCNTLALVRNYSNLFYFYSASGQLKQKYEAIDSCLAYALQGRSGFDMVVGPLNDKIEYLFNTGEYSFCTRDAKLGEDIIQKYYHGKDSIEFIVFYVSTYANALRFSKDIFSAEKLLEGKIPAFQQTGNSKQLGAFYSLLGLISRDKGNYTKALCYFQKAFRANLDLKFKKGCAQNLATIGILYAKAFNRFDIGLKYCARAFQYADGTDSLFILEQEGNIYVLKGMFEKAQYCFQQAFNTVQDGMNETVMLRSSFQFPGFNLLQSLSDLTTDKGDAYVKQYDHTKNDSFLRRALNIYKKADLFLAKIKTEQGLQLSSSLVWRTTARNLYEHAIEACYAGKNIEDAFYFFEKSRAILLNDQINEERWMVDEDIAKQANLKRTVVDLERRLGVVPVTSEEYLTIQKNLYTSSQELDKLIHSIKDKNPLFYQNYLDTVFMTIPQLRKDILNDSKSLLEIFSGDSAAYVLIITNKDQSLTRLNKLVYDSLTGSFNSYISNLGKLNSDFAGFMKTANRLYFLLFQNKAPSDGSMIISPDGANYPFEGLVMNANDRLPDYFLNHYATSYTYSVKYLTNQFTVNATAGNSVLGIAPVDYKNYRNLSDLSGSDVSLRNINSYFSDAKNCVFSKATKSNFLQNFPRYNIIQIYAHAADSSINNDPVIYFVDSALYLSDLIPFQKTITKLVVLSACETGKGKLYQGEGIFSFNRGFAALGIPEAISNLWSVENESTYSSTELFYKYLSQGFPTDIALQKAKLEFIKNSSSKEKKLPYFWAASVLTGKVDIIKSVVAFPWVKLVIVTVLLLFVGYFKRKMLYSNLPRFLKSTWLKFSQ